MTQVSRFPLSKALENQIYELFYGVLADFHTRRDIENFLDDLLTPTEKVMLAKRLAIALLLEKGYDQHTIHTMMKVSLSTVNSVNFWLKQKGNGYRKAIGMVRKEEKWLRFAERLDDILRELFSKKAIYKRAYGG